MTSRLMTRTHFRPYLSESSPLKRKSKRQRQSQDNTREGETDAHDDGSERPEQQREGDGERDFVIFLVELLCQRSD